MLYLGMAWVLAQNDGPVGDQPEFLDDLLSPAVGHGHAAGADSALRQHEDMGSALPPRLLRNVVPRLVADEPSPSAVVMAQRERIELLAILGARVAILGDQDAGTVRFVDIRKGLERAGAIPENEEVGRVRPALPLHLDLEAHPPQALSEHARPIMLRLAKHQGAAHHGAP
jgi:hypothetical protein